MNSLSPTQPFPDALSIIGCGGHSRSVIDTLIRLKPDIRITLYDPNAKANEQVLGFPVLPFPFNTSDALFAALGDGAQRLDLMKKYPSLNWVNIVDPLAHLGIAAQFGSGIFIGAKAHIGPQSYIGTGTIINTHSIVEHESRIGSFCHLAPRSVICGRCKVGDHVFIGAGSIVIDQINIASHITIGAGSTVVHDLMDPGLYVGTPARLKSK